MRPVNTPDDGVGEGERGAEREVGAVGATTAVKLPPLSVPLLPASPRKVRLPSTGAWAEADVERALTPRVKASASGANLIRRVIREPGIKPLNNREMTTHSSNAMPVGQWAFVHWKSLKNRE
jgi:hypothetical protein